jgi:diaminopimelate epimerase
MIEQTAFLKISATGNDFILIDNREGRFEAVRDAQTFSRLCRHRIAVGADGVILLEKSKLADFRYVHINSDGSIAEMCGNGSRAIAWFAHHLGLIQTNATFEINDNIYHVALSGLRVTTEFVPPGKPILDLDIIDEAELEVGGFIDTGVPHLVLYVKESAAIDVDRIGRKYRSHPFFPHGTNVDFAQIRNMDTANVRTFERGVEAETLACGTGAVAVAVISQIRKVMRSPSTLCFPGGELTVSCSDDFTRVKLTGLVTPVYRGVIEESFHA